MTPTEIACRHVCFNPEENHCAAESGDPCNWSGCDVDQVEPFHAERREDAIAMTTEPLTDKELALLKAAIQKVVDETL